MSQPRVDPREWALQRRQRILRARQMRDERRARESTAADEPDQEEAVPIRNEDHYAEEEPRYAQNRYEQERQPTQHYADVDTSQLNQQQPLVASNDVARMDGELAKIVLRMMLDEEPSLIGMANRHMVSLISAHLGPTQTPLQRGGRRKIPQPIQQPEEEEQDDIDPHDLFSRGLRERRTGKSKPEWSGPMDDGAEPEEPDRSQMRLLSQRRGQPEKRKVVPTQRKPAVERKPAPERRKPVEKKPVIDDIECSSCGRVFPADRIERHERTCTKASKPKPSVRRVQRKQQPAPVPVFSDSVDDQIVGGGGNRGWEAALEQQLREDEASSRVRLVSCRQCGRKFNKDRIGKHEGACQASAPKRKVFDSSKARVEGTDAAKFSPTTRRSGRGGRAGRGRAPAPKKKGGKWRAEHDNFINMLRGARAITAAEKRGEAPPMDLPEIKGVEMEMVACPHCGRTFNEKAADRHIPHCAKMINRPTTLSRKTKVSGVAGRRGRR